MKPTISLSKSGPNPDAIKKMMMDLQKTQVYVGTPEDKTSRNGDHVTNAGLIYIHTHGSPLKGIPARPIIEPAIEAPDNKAAIAAELGLAAAATLDPLTGTAVPTAKAEVHLHLKRAGMEAQNRVRAWFDDPRNGWAPNAPATIAAKGSDHPLVDKAEMKKSITYVVDEG